MVFIFILKVPHLENTVHQLWLFKSISFSRGMLRGENYSSPCVSKNSHSHTHTHFLSASWVMLWGLIWIQTDINEITDEDKKIKASWDFWEKKIWQRESRTGGQRDCEIKFWPHQPTQQTRITSLVPNLYNKTELITRNIEGQPEKPNDVVRPLDKVKQYIYKDDIKLKFNGSIPVVSEICHSPDHNQVPVTGNCLHIKQARRVSWNSLMWYGFIECQFSNGKRSICLH